MSLLNSLIPSLNRQPAPRVETPAVEPEPTIKPVFELSETPEGWTLAVMLPGVAKDGVELTVDETQIKVVGRRAWRQPAGWTAIMLKRLDWAYIRFGGARTGLPHPPSYYWKRQFFVTFEDDALGVRTRDYIGTNTIIVIDPAESDFYSSIVVGR